MASYDLTGTGGIAVHAKTLVANTVDTVTLDSDWDWVEVVSDGAGALYVRVDGSNPTVAGPNAFVLPAGVASSREIKVRTSTPTVVKLISPGTPTYSVMALPT